MIKSLYGNGVVLLLSAEKYSSKGDGICGRNMQEKVLQNKTNKFDCLDMQTFKMFWNPSRYSNIRG